MGVQNQDNNFGSIFGNAAAADAPSTGGKADRTPSQYWLNIGRETGEGDEARFVRLPLGVAVDGMKATPIKGSNADYNEFTQAGNNMLARVQEICGELAPGESKIVNLQVELRRINSEVEAPVLADDSKYASAMDF